ncbi:hypothetical protein OC845_005742 [Tilletia horrida]|nr:hypothetical protein OC845_005742 [Tilletia horrida]
MVNDRLKDEIAQLHAFSQHPMTTKQYAARSQAQGSSGTSAAAASAGSSAAAAAAAAPTTSTTSLAEAATIAAPSKATGHGRTPSAISIPELTLTTEMDVVRGSSGTPATGGSGGQLTPSSSVSMVGETPIPSPQSPRISRLQLSKLQSTEFWLALRDFLEGQFGAGAAAASPSLDPISALPNTSSPGGASPRTGSRGHSPSNSMSLSRARGEPEAAQVWENFFLSAKEHLSASEIARVRDVVGYTAQGGV